MVKKGLSKRTFLVALKGIVVILLLIFVLVGCASAQELNEEVIYLPTVFASGIDEPQVGLEVSGNRLTRYGEEIKLHCISIGEVVEFEWRNLELEYEMMRELYPSVNCVRISSHPGYFRQDQDLTLELMADHITEARKRSMVIIIDYHVIGWPDGYTQESPWYPPEFQLYDSSFELAIAFHTAIAQEFHGNDIIIELWNEPIYEENPAAELPDNNRWPELKAFLQELVDVYRSNGNNAILLYTGGSWGFDLRGIRQNPLDDSRTIVGWHRYASEGGNDPKFWEKATDGVYKDFVLFVGEWGFDPNTDEHWRGTAEDYGYPFIEFMDNHDLHSGGWNWNAYYGPGLLELDPWLEGEFVLTDWGRFLQEYWSEE